MTVAEIDDTLRQALSRIAPDADSTGVADAIRARVAAGDTGTPATSSGFRTGIRGWLPFLILIVVVAVLGFGLGMSGLLGHPAAAHLTARSTSSVAAGTPTATSEATPTSSATPTSVVSVAPVAPPAPAPPAPPKAKDTTPPTLVVGTPSADTIWGIGSSCTPTATTISTTSSDASGVASTTAVSSVAGSVIVHSGGPGATVFTVSVNEPGTDSIKTVTITVTSTDSQGNVATGKANFSLWGAQNCIG